MGIFSYRIGLLLFGLQLAWMAVPCRAATIEPTAESIQQLVEKLGSDEFFVRQRAETELLSIGPDAFDALMSADDNDDLEIASRARYILSRMRVEWVRPDDTPAVQQLMSHYGDLPLVERQKRIAGLAALDEDQGLVALCRVARYDTSPLQARRAALEIITKENPPPERGTRGVQLLAREVGDSRRAPIGWIRTYSDQWSSPASAVGRWRTWIDAERELLAKDFGETTEVIVSDLLEHQLTLCNDLLESHTAIRPDALAAVESMVDHQSTLQGDIDLGLSQFLVWIRIQEKWNVLSILEDRYETQIKEHRRLLYLVAATRVRQGREKEAQEIADRAFQFSDNDNDERNAIADELIALGRVDWAEREWRLVVESFPVADDHSAAARSSLASWCLHDRCEDQEAAQLLTDYLEAIDNRQEKKPKDADLYDGTGRFRAQRDFYLACHAESQKDYALQQKLLESAIKYNDTDADILIAMYHLQDADEEFRSKTNARIQRVGARLLAAIERDPDEPHWCNHWAWMISNTEGDFEKAVELSRRSIELSPDEASYLDTLGRCYYAAGDLENAIKYQRQAVNLNPQLRVMQKQLAQFEAEWKENQK